MNNLYYNESQYPESLNIYFSKGSIKIGFIISFCLFLLGLYLFFTLKSGFIFWLLPIVFSMSSLYSTIKMNRNIKNIQLRISDSYIVIKEDKIFHWQNISDEKIEEIQSGKSTITHLTFYYNNRKVLFKVEDLDFDSYQLETALKIYRKRFENPISQ